MVAPEQTLQSGAVVGTYAHRDVYRKPAAIGPVEHAISVGWIQDAAAPEPPQHPAPNLLGQRLDLGWRCCAGRMKMGLAVGSELKYAIDDAAVEMQVTIE